ncbi:MAG TPA: hypothetical protein VIY51_18215, partial [Xanthobacteraceae bacterium]
MLSAIAVAVVLFAEQGYAQSASTSSFNHFSTGFPLTGTHLSVSCASCHVNGRMKNTPTQCIGCHNTMTAPGEPQSHPKTTNRCENCHLTTTWRDIAFMDHTQATGPCASCHNNKLAVGKSPNHIVTAAPCGNCHRNTVTFAGATVPANTPAQSSAVPLAIAPPAAATAPANPPALNSAASRATAPPAAGAPAATAPSTRPNMSHLSVSNGCATCHNGAAAPGKPPNHVLTSAPCENCHKSTVTFAGAGMNHAGIIANCASCHSGGAATGKPANHVATNAPCETCHKSTVTFEGARLDHGRITGTCAGCHNGTTNEGKPPGHLVTALPCETCHRTVTWTAVSYQHTSLAYVNHGAGVSCTGCHTTNAQIVPWKFAAFRPGCGGCHADKYRPMLHPKFERPVKVYYPITELRDCTG